MFGDVLDKIFKLSLKGFTIFLTLYILVSLSLYFLNFLSFNYLELEIIKDIAFGMSLTLFGISALAERKIMTKSRLFWKLTYIMPVVAGIYLILQSLKKL